MRHEGVLKYIYSYVRTIQIWFFLTILIDGIFKAYFWFKNVELLKEITFLSLMALLPALSLSPIFKKKLSRQVIDIFKISKFIGALIILKGMFSFSFLFRFSTGVARDHFGPKILWWFANYNEPIIYGIFLTFCFAFISALFWPEIEYSLYGSKVGSKTIQDHKNFWENKDAEAEYNSGLQKERAKVYRDALQHYANAIRLAPSNWKPYFAKGGLLGILKNFQGAKDTYLEAIKKNNNIALLWFGLSQAEMELKNYKSACDAAQKAIDIDPNLGYAKKVLYYCKNKIK